MTVARRLWGACAAAIPALAAGAQGPVPKATGFGSLLQALFGLIVVLAVLLAFLWLLRRFSPGQMGGSSVARVVGGVMVGPRERLVVVEVGESWLLLGVAAGHVSHVHTMPKPAEASFSPGSPLPSPFAGKVAEFLSRRKSS